MRSKHNQNKFIRFIKSPIRVLGKAKDLYVRSLTNYATRTSHSNSTYGLGQFSGLHKSFSVGSSRDNDTEDYRELIRAASVRSMGHINEVDMFIHLQHMKQSERKMGSKGFPKSCSVGMGFMGRIDEEKSSDFEESVDSKKSELGPRSRSVAPRSRGVAV